MKKPRDVKQEQARDRKERARFSRLAGKIKPSGKIYKRAKRIIPE